MMNQVETRDSDPESLFDSELFVDKSYTVQTISEGNVDIKIHALHTSSSTDYDLTGQIIWPASRLLSIYLSGKSDKYKSARVLEVGAGVGLSGLVAAKVSSHPSRVVLTDHNDNVLELLQKNIKENFDNSHDCPKCVMLHWGCDLEKFQSSYGDFDVIIGADVVFWPHAVPLLMETVAYFMKRNPICVFILSYISRSGFSTDLLFQCAKKQNLTWKYENLETDIAYCELLEQEKKCGRTGNIIIFTMMYKDV